MNEIIISNRTMPELYSADYLVASTPFYHADRTLDFNVMIYVTKGEICVTEENTDYAVGEGELLFLKKGLHHLGKTEIKAGTAWYYAHFNEGVIRENYRDCSRTGENCTSIAVLPKKLAGLEGTNTENMIMSFVNDYVAGKDRWKANARLFEVLSDVAFFMQNMPRKDKSLADKICDYLDCNVEKAFSGKVLEKQFFLSYKYMAGVFKRSKMCTMQEYHTKMQMREGCRLLRTTQLNVSEIAAQLGYNDVLYFSRRFHSVVGTSPTQYRRKLPY